MDAAMPPPVREFWANEGQAKFTEFVTALRS
jgi:hypothetical protein